MILGYLHTETQLLILNKICELMGNAYDLLLIFKQCNFSRKIFEYEAEKILGGCYKILQSNV